MDNITTTTINNTNCKPPNHVQRNETNVPSYYYPINTIFLILIPAYYILTIIWFKYEQPKSLYLQKRSLMSIIACSFGCLAMYIEGPIRNTQSATFSCDFFLIVTIMAIPLVLTPMALRLYMFKTSLDWNKYLAKTSISRLNQAVGFEQVITTDDKHFSQQRRKKSLFDGISSSSLSESSGSKSTTSDNVTLALRFRSSNVFLLSLGFMSYTIFFLIFVLPFLLSKPYYLNGCVGCLYDVDEFASAYVSAIACASMFMYFGWNVRHEKDPLNIKRELIWCFPVAIVVGSIGAIGTLLDAGLNQNLIEDAGIIQFDWFLIFAVLWVHFYQCPLQIIIARGYGRIKAQDVPSRTEFITLLNNPAFMTMFESFCISEFSIEHLKYYSSVQIEFKSKYNDTMTKLGERYKVALAIFNAYISEGAVMEINIKYTVRKHLLEIFDSTNMIVPIDIPITIFDASQGEILDLMWKDSLPRFVNTKEYRDWANGAIAVKDGVMTVLS
jgi:hypothetical protein